MHHRSRHLALTGLLLLAPAAAIAQPSPLPGGSPGGEEEPKPEGIAESAPKAAGLLATTPTLPPPRDRRKKFEVISVDGYLRARGDWLKNLNLGFKDIDSVGGAPFPRSTGCSIGSPAPCKDSIKTSNMRLRLEPSILLSDTISVHTQIDMLDNVVLGTPVETGAADDTISVRRAWAEVSTALGFLKFGRMPDHFGLGMVANSGRRNDTDYASWETTWQPATLADVGGNNDVSYDIDSDYGDTVDRFMVTGGIPGTPLRLAAALDWPGSGPTSQLARGAGQNFDLDDNNDKTGWMLSIARIDAPSEFADRVARGKLGLNYAARLVRRHEFWVYNPGTNPGDPMVPVQRNSSLYIPGAWVKVGWKKLLVEAEAGMQLGSIDNLADVDPAITGKTDVRSWGGVVRVSDKALDDKLGFGLEVGAASGGSRDNTPEGATNLRNASLLPGIGDTTESRFIFNPDYKIDLILFRQLIGSVSNAAYFRPWLSYQLTKSITFHGQGVTSAALKPVSTPGNAAMWGVEFDGDLAYRGNGFTAGLAYGGFFPLSAMNHPSSSDGGPGFHYIDAVNNIDNSGDAGNAHTFQARFAVEF